MNDATPMPYGIHAGTPMEEVPADYLLWQYERGNCKQAVKEYTEDNIEALRLEQERDRRADPRARCYACAYLTERRYPDSYRLFCSLRGRRMAADCLACENIKYYG